MVKMFEDVSDEVLANEFKHEGYKMVIEFMDGQKINYNDVERDGAFKVSKRFMDLPDVRSVKVSR
jgi:hypothetical protein